MFGTLKLNRVSLFCTHPGRFHLDEILAIALILKFHPGCSKWDEDLRIIKDLNDEWVLSFNYLNRGNKAYTGLIKRSADPEIHKEFKFVIDTGFKHDPKRGLFDHHQYKGGDSACMLVFNWLMDEGYIDPVVFQFMFPTILGYSGWDTGETLNQQLDLLKSFEEETGAKIKTFSEVLSGFNRTFNSEDLYLEAWKAVFNIVWLDLKNTIAKAKEYKRDLKDVKAAKILGPFDEILASKKTFISNWQKINDSFIYQVAPGSRKGEFGVTSCDSSRWPLPYPEDESELVFYHANKFYASFSSWDAALSYAKKVVN